MITQIEAQINTEFADDGADAYIRAMWEEAIECDSSVNWNDIDDLFDGGWPEPSIEDDAAWIRTGC